MMKMRIMSTGIPQVHQPRRKRGNFKPLPASASAMKLSHDQPNVRVHYNANTKRPLGRR